MKPTLARFSAAIAALGALVGAVDLYVAHLLVPGDEHPIAPQIAFVYLVLGIAQVIPLLGIGFAVDLIRGREARVWTRARRSLWMVWVMAALPIVVAGTLGAAVFVMIRFGR